MTVRSASLVLATSCDRYRGCSGSKDLRAPERDTSEVLLVDVNLYYSIRSSCESSDRSLLHESSGFNQHVKTGNSIGVGPRKVPTTVTLLQCGFSTNKFFVFYHASDESATKFDKYAPTPGHRENLGFLNGRP